MQYDFRTPQNQITSWFKVIKYHLKMHTPFKIHHRRNISYPLKGTLLKISNPLIFLIFFRFSSEYIPLKICSNRVSGIKKDRPLTHLIIYKVIIIHTSCRVRYRYGACRTFFQSMHITVSEIWEFFTWEPGTINTANTWHSSLRSRMTRRLTSELTSPCCWSSRRTVEWSLGGRHAGLFSIHTPFPGRRTNCSSVGTLQFTIYSDVVCFAETHLKWIEMNVTWKIQILTILCDPLGQTGGITKNFGTYAKLEPGCRLCTSFTLEPKCCRSYKWNHFIHKFWSNKQSW